MLGPWFAIAAEAEHGPSMIARFELDPSPDRGENREAGNRVERSVGRDLATMTTESPPKPALKAKPGQGRARQWLARMLFSPQLGMRNETFRMLLRENRHAVSPQYWPKAAIVWAASLAASSKSRREEREFGDKVRAATVRPPLFVLGHWRSGTTLLHNLIALDKRFTYPDLYQCTNPNTFLLATPRDYAFLDRLLPKTRGLDNMAVGARETTEDEIAICTMSTRSPYMRAFPKNAERYEKYLTFRDVPETEVAEWADALVRFLKKLTVLNDRPVALKSPTHTARVGLLLKLFPDAKFLHIRRDPYAVYRSTVNAERLFVEKRGHFQPVSDEGLEGEVLERYQRLYEPYFDERSLIPAGNLHELAFEDLERDPLDQLRTAYRALALADFEVVSPVIEAYLSGQADYRKNEFRPMDPALKARVAEGLGRYFEEWGYPID